MLLETFPYLIFTILTLRSNWGIYTFIIVVIINYCFYYYAYLKDEKYLAQLVSKKAVHEVKKCHKILCSFYEP